MPPRLALPHALDAASTALRVEPLYRSFHAGRDPVYFGKSGRSRFDDPRRDHGVLYAGLSYDCAFVETLGHNVGIGSVASAGPGPAVPHGGRVISRDRLRATHLALVFPSRPLRLLDLTGDRLHAFGVDAHWATTHDYPVTQTWSRQTREHAGAVDGLLYRSRLDPQQVGAALFDRAAPAVQSYVDLGALDEPPLEAWTAQLLGKYGYRVV